MTIEEAKAIVRAEYSRAQCRKIRLNVANELYGWYVWQVYPDGESWSSGVAPPSRTPGDAWKAAAKAVQR